MEIVLKNEKIINGKRFKKNSIFTVLGTKHDVMIVFTSAGIAYLHKEDLIDIEGPILNKKDLPNINGFSFMAVYGDGLIQNQSVMKNPDGSYYIKNYDSIKGWYPMSKTKSHDSKR